MDLFCNRVHIGRSRSSKLDVLVAVENEYRLPISRSL